MNAYLTEVQSLLSTGQATEHSYRSAVERLFKARGLTALNEPKQGAVGSRPDFEVSNGRPIGHVECKDVGEDLQEVENTHQVVKYRESLPNLLLTDHLEWRWYVEGRCRGIARVGTYAKGKVKIETGGPEEVLALIMKFAACDVSLAPPTERRQFGLKVAETTYQRLRQAAFDKGESISVMCERFLLAGLGASVKVEPPTATAITPVATVAKKVNAPVTPDIGDTSLDAPAKVWRPAYKAFVESVLALGKGDQINPSYLKDVVSIDYPGGTLLLSNGKYLSVNLSAAEHVKRCDEMKAILRKAL